MADCEKCTKMDECRETSGYVSGYCGAYRPKEEKREGEGKRMSTYTSIYAVDFDGTLCESQWPGIGAPNRELIGHLIRCREEGCRVILWTCRIGDRLQEAVDWCKGYGLEFDAVNDNLPENIEKYGNNPRKIYATCYIDDL